MLRRVLLGLALVSGLSMFAGAEDKAPSRMLFITQSAGFKHSSVTRKEGHLAPAEIAIKTLGEHKFHVRLHREVSIELPVNVVKEEE